MIKKYRDFLRESRESDDFSESEARLVIYLTNLSEPSYSCLISYNDNWEEDKTKLLLDIKSELNLSMDDIINFFDSSQIWQKFLYNVDQLNGIVDRFIYEIWENLNIKYPNIKWERPILGGGSYGTDWVNPRYSYDDGKTEFEYKYEYGFHLTEYGQKMIANQNVNLKDFIKRWFSDYFDWNKFNKMLVDNFQTEIEINHWNNDYFILEEDRIIFYYQDFIDDNNGNINVERLKEKVLNFLNLNKYDDNGNQMRIWFEPKNIYHQTKTPKPF